MLLCLPSYDIVRRDSDRNDRIVVIKQLYDIMWQNYIVILYGMHMFMEYYNMGCEEKKRIWQNVVCSLSRSIVFYARITNRLANVNN